MSAWQDTAECFECEGDHLVGVLSAPANSAPEVGVVIVVGGPQYRAGAHRQFTLTARAVAAAGHAALRFDYRGMGDSTGARRRFDEVSEDIAAAVQHLKQRTGCQRVVLLGLCDAASACLIFADDHSHVPLAGLCLMNPWARSEAGMAKAQVRHYYLSRLVSGDFWRKLLTGGVGLAALRGFATTAKQAAVSKATGASPESRDFLTRMQAGLSKFKGAVLLTISGDDLTAKEFEMHVAQSNSWRDALARDSVRTCRLESADHTFSRADDLSSFNRELVRWIQANAQLVRSGQK